MMTECIQLCRECAEICASSSKLMSMDSGYVINRLHRPTLSSKNLSASIYNKGRMIQRKQSQK